jgi:hypothetical protein
MNKKTFTVEFATQNDLVGALTHEDFDYILRRGLVEYMGNFYAQNVKITFVEQTCGTVDFAEKSVELLGRAKKRLNECESYHDGSNNDELCAEIDSFLSGKQ